MLSSGPNALYNLQHHLILTADTCRLFCFYLIHQQNRRLKWLDFYHNSAEMFRFDVATTART